jgi:hypothetical protein
VHRIVEERELTAKELALLERLIQHGTKESHNYADQLPHLTVVARCDCGCPTIDLAVRGKTAALGSPSRIVSEASGISPERLRFGIILHAREGRLSELEAYATDANGAFTFPELDEIEFWKSAF